MHKQTLSGPNSASDRRSVDFIIGSIFSGDTIFTPSPHTAKLLQISYTCLIFRPCPSLKEDPSGPGTLAAGYAVRIGFAVGKPDAPECQIAGHRLKLLKGKITGELQYLTQKVDIERRRPLI